MLEKKTQMGVLIITKCVGGSIFSPDKKKLATEEPFEIHPSKQDNILIDSDLCIYKFLIYCFSHNSPLINFPTKRLLQFYSFYTSFLHSFIM